MKYTGIAKIIRSQLIFSNVALLSVASVFAGNEALARTVYIVPRPQQSISQENKEELSKDGRLTATEATKRATVSLEAKMDPITAGAMYTQDDIKNDITVFTKKQASASGGGRSGSSGSGSSSSGGSGKPVRAVTTPVNPTPDNDILAGSADSLSCELNILHQTACKKPDIANSLYKIGQNQCVTHPNCQNFKVTISCDPSLVQNVKCDRPIDPGNGTQPAQKIVVASAIQYKGQPNNQFFYDIGMILNRAAGNFWWPLNDLQNLPSKEVICQYAKNNLFTGGDQGIGFINDEYPSPKGPAQVIAATQERLLYETEAYKACNPAPIGHYNYPQVRMEAAWGYAPGSQPRVEMHEYFQSWKSFVNKHDVVYPSFYTYYDCEDPKLKDHWRIMAESNVAELRQITDKPIYAFIHPMYHLAADLKIRNKPIPAHCWRDQLETLKALKVNIVIWAGWEVNPATGLYFQADWNPNSPWWLETVDFMKKL